MTRMAPVCAIGLLALSAPSGLAHPGVSLAAETPVADETLDHLRIPAEQRRRLIRGEIAAYQLNETSDRDLAVGLAIFVSATMSQVAEYLATGRLITEDAGLAAYGMMPDQVNREALSGVRFSGGERDEAESLLEASAGSRFNLSVAEIEALHTLRTSREASVRTGVAEMVSEEYRRLLHQRCQAYQRDGLAGMAPYARSGGTVTDPAAELRRAASDAERLPRSGQELSETLLRYPAAQPPHKMASRFYWIKRRVQRRPTLSLLHQMVMGDPDLVIHVERYFYVGHSYNAGQIITGAVPHQQGAVVFVTSRFSTDEVLGVGSQLKRTVGRGQLTDEMRKRLERLRASLSRPPSVQSP
jgi:hypothetical protein